MRDWESVAWMAASPHDNIRAEAASVAWQHGPRAESLLIGLLSDQSLYPDSDVATLAADGLGTIGGEASRAPLLNLATRSSVRYGRRESAKAALLAVEARLGILNVSPRREGFWEELPTQRSQTREPIASFWRLARKEGLHGTTLAMALVSPDVWTRRQALAAALEQETEPDDLDVLVRWLDDPKLDLARALWRYGTPAEPILLDHLGPSAAESLARIGSERSLSPLRNHGSMERAIEAIEARLRPAPAE